MLYTVLSNTLKIGKDQLKAAISFWQYCQHSAQWALGQQTGNRMADRILWALSNESLGMTRSEIRQEIFSRNCANIALDIALSALVNAELAYVKHEQIPGARRKVERWFAGNKQT